MAKRLVNFLPHKFLLWVISAIIITGFSGLVYIAVQTDMRQGAHDPQIQMAEDSATALNAGEKVSPIGSVDIGNSLGSFIIIYNDQGKVTSSGARLNNATPQVPQSVFATVKAEGEKHFTWQPEVGVRIAAVMVPYNSGYVLAGRSLREVEKREDTLGKQVAIVWILAMTATTMLSILL